MHSSGKVLGKTPSQTLSSANVPVPLHCAVKSQRKTGVRTSIYRAWKEDKKHLFLPCLMAELHHLHNSVSATNKASYDGGLSKAVCFSLI